MTTTKPLLQFVRDHGLKYRDIADGSGMNLSAVHAIVNGFRSPRVDNVVRLLTFFRTIDPAVTFESLFEQKRGKRAA